MLRKAVLPVVLIVLAACGEEGGGASRGGGGGSALFSSQGCALCHGPDGAGTSFGPTLQGKKQFWTREKLMGYLRNPVAYAEKDKRLSDQARHFTGPMQRFDKLKAEELSALADYVLTFP